MARLARTVVRFAAALFLGGLASVYDNRDATAPRIEVLRHGVEVRKVPAPLGIIQVGKRAFEIRVPRTALVEFGIRPNSRVEVVAGVQNSNATERPAAAILLSDVRVLAVRPVPQRPNDSGARGELVVTLEVSPEEAAALAAVQAKGALGLALRRGF